MRHPLPLTNAAGCLVVALATVLGGLSLMSAHGQESRAPMMLAVRGMPLVAAVPDPAPAAVANSGTATMLVGLATLIATQLFAYLKQKNDTATASKIASLEAEVKLMNRMMSERSPR